MSKVLYIVPVRTPRAPISFFSKKSETDPRYKSSHIRS
nr:MAG TPA_asm: hypothetical protein [Caudoviricetes sp.]